MRTFCTVLVGWVHYLYRAVLQYPKLKGAEWFCAQLIRQVALLIKDQFISIKRWSL